MYLITFLAIIILISNSAFCHLPNGNLDVSVLPKMVNFPLDETAEFEENDRSVYDPGVEEKTGKLFNIKLGLYLYFIFISIPNYKLCSNCVRLRDT